MRIGDAAEIKLEANHAPITYSQYTHIVYTTGREQSITHTSIDHIPNSIPTHVLLYRAIFYPWCSNVQTQERSISPPILLTLRYFIHEIGQLFTRRVANRYRSRNAAIRPPTQQKEATDLRRLFE